MSHLHTFQTNALVIELVAVADAFEIAFVAVDAGDQVSNEYPCVGMSLKYLFVMTFQLIGFLWCWKVLFVNDTGN